MSCDSQYCVALPHETLCGLHCVIVLFTDYSQMLFPSEITDKKALKFAFEVKKIIYLKMIYIVCILFKPRALLSV